MSDETFPDKTKVAASAADADLSEKTTLRPAKRRRKHPFWHGVHLIWLVAVMPVLITGIVVFLLVDRDITAPSWIKSRIAATASAVLGGGEVSFGALYVTIGRDLHPRVRLVDTTVVDATGATIARISQISGLMSPRGLLFEQSVLMQDIALSGAQIDLQRNVDGSVALSFGAVGSAAAQQAERLTELLDQADQVLVRPNFAALETLRAENLVVNYVDARAERRWTVDGGLLTLDLRDDKTELRADMALLSGGAGVTTLVLNYDSPRGSRAADLGVTITDAVAADIASQSPALSWLSDFDAPISATLRTTLDEGGALGPLSATLELGQGALQPNDATAPIAFDSAKMYLVLDAAKDALRFDQIEVASSMGSFTASGQAFLDDNVAGLPQTFVGQLQFRNLDLRPTDALAAPLDYTQAQIDLRLNLNPFSVDIGQFYLEGSDLALHGQGHVAATDKGWQVALDLEAAAINQAAVVALWPTTMHSYLRGWVSDNLVLTQMTSLQMAVRSTPDAPLYLSGSFGFADSAVTYMPQMPPITNASGIMSFDAKRFTVALDQGRITPPEGGVLDVAASTLVMNDITIHPTPTLLDLRFDGTMAASMSLMDQPPFGYANWFNIPVAFAQGRAATRVRVAMPMTTHLQEGDVVFDVEAEVRDFETGFLVGGRNLSARRLDLRMDNAGMTVTGAALLDGISLSGTWDQRFDSGGRSTLQADLELSQAALDALDVALPPGSVSGSGSARLDMTLNMGGSANYTLTSNLRGISVAIPPIGWSKPRNTAGNFRLVGTLGNQPTIDRLQISGGGLDAEGRIILNRDGSLDRAIFSKLRVGDWLNAPITLRGRGANRPVAVAIQGGTLDLRRARFGPSTGESGPLSIALDRLQLAEGIALTRFAGDFDGSGGFSGTFTAQMNGAAALLGTVASRNGGSAVRIRSDDAGGIVRAAGLMDNAVGGSLDLTLVPTGDEGTFDGALAIRQLRVRDAPAMAALLDAVSVVGALQQMDGQGLAFDEVDARFRLTPRQMILTQSSAVGAGLGISLDGIYTLAGGQMDFQGVISPFYLVNSIGAFLTRQGEGLIGFNFNLYGSAAAPQISVNPFSALTPGMFREIFRRPPPVLSQ